MDFRRLFGMFLHTTIRPDTKRKCSTQPSAPQNTGHTHVRYAEAYPAHTCVDQPILSCPACLKWTGDGFASVRANPEGFPGIFGQPATKPIQNEPSGYAVMVRVKFVDGWAWRTWMRYDTYEQAASHRREGQKIVPFGSDEWKALLGPQDASDLRNVQDLVQGEIFVDSVLRSSDKYTSTNTVGELKSCAVTKSSESGDYKSAARVGPQSCSSQSSRSETPQSPGLPQHLCRDSFSPITSVIPKQPKSSR
jgi:hypothetical protein